MTKLPKQFSLHSPLLSAETISFVAPADVTGPASANALLAKANEKHIVVTQVTYRSNGHRVIGFIVAPKNSKGLLPCIIVNRGGNRETGAWTATGIFGKLGRLALLGYVVAASQYSGAGGSEGKDEFGGKEIADVLALRRVLACHRLADTNRIGMMGTSRGGLMTYLAMAKVRWIKAAVVISGSADKVRGARLRPEMKAEHKATFGGSLSELKKRSPVRWAGKLSKKTPLLMLHGTDDWRVIALDSIDMSRELLKAGNTNHQLVVFEGGDHGLTTHATERDVMTDAWFSRFLK